LSSCRSASRFSRCERVFDCRRVVIHARAHKSNLRSSHPCHPLATPLAPNLQIAQRYQNRCDEISASALANQLVSPPYSSEFICVCGDFRLNANYVVLSCVRIHLFQLRDPTDHEVTLPPSAVSPVTNQILCFLCFSFSLSHSQFFSLYSRRHRCTATPNAIREVVAAKQKRHSEQCRRPITLSFSHRHLDLTPASFSTEVCCICDETPPRTASNQRQVVERHHIMQTRSASLNSRELWYLRKAPLHVV
jgi:hypothetical protein